MYKHARPQARTPRKGHIHDQRTRAHVFGLGYWGCMQHRIHNQDSCRTPPGFFCHRWGRWSFSYCAPCCEPHCHPELYHRLYRICQINLPVDIVLFCVHISMSTLYPSLCHIFTINDFTVPTMQVLCACLCRLYIPYFSIHCPLLFPQVNGQLPLFISSGQWSSLSWSATASSKPSATVRPGGHAHTSVTARRHADCTHALHPLLIVVHTRDQLPKVECLWKGEGIMRYLWRRSIWIPHPKHQHHHFEKHRGSRRHQPIELKTTTAGES